MNIKYLYQHYKLKNTTKLENNLTTTHKRMVKEIVVCQNRVLHKSENDWTIATYNKTNKPLKHNIVVKRKCQKIIYIRHYFFINLSNRKNFTMYCLSLHVWVPKLKQKQEQKRKHNTKYNIFVVSGGKTRR